MDTPFSQEILNKLKERFSDEVIKTREGPAKKVGKDWVKQTFAYIPTDHLHERLDAVLGLYWNWEILGQTAVKFQKTSKIKKYREDGSNRYDMVESTREVEQIVVWGRLTIKLNETTVVSRDAFGGCDVGYGSQAGDSFKIADSNAFKKACYKFGIGRYLGLEGLENDTLVEEDFNKPKNRLLLNKPTEPSLVKNEMATKAKASVNPFIKK